MRKLFSKVIATTKRPSRILKLLDHDALRGFAAARTKRNLHHYKRRMNKRIGFNWSKEVGGRIHRQYADYDTYLAHQRAKLLNLDLSEYNVKFRAALRDRLPDCSGLSVICLAAREGAECLAFRDRGAFAIGIDLNPGPDNAHVLPGDFHALQFADECIDRVFTNSLDHAFDLEAVCAEIQRVLKPGGVFIAEVGCGSDEGVKPRQYEAHWWARADDLIVAISKCGFKVASKRSIDVPWRGEQVSFGRA